MARAVAPARRNCSQELLIALPMMPMPTRPGIRKSMYRDPVSRVMSSVAEPDRRVRPRPAGPGWRAAGAVRRLRVGVVVAIQRPAVRRRLDHHEDPAAAQCVGGRVVDSSPPRRAAVGRSAAAVSSDVAATRTVSAGSSRKATPSPAASRIGKMSAQNNGLGLADELAKPQQRQLHQRMQRQDATHRADASRSAPRTRPRAWPSVCAVR